MREPDGKSLPTAEPKSSATHDNSPAIAPASPATIEQARKFLQDDEVRSASRERKMEFLKSKGLQESQAVELLAEESKQGPTLEEEQEASRESKDAAAQEELQSQSPPETQPDHPPIVTYPEFLTKPTKPPPLMTVSGFLSSLYAFGGLSALIYGTSKLVLRPMVDELTEARVDLHGTAARHLASLIEKLEATVSEIPTAAAAKTSGNQARGYGGEGEEGADVDSSCEDPTELFHRDIGVQTSLPASPRLPPSSSSPQSSPAQPASERQAKTIADLAASVRAVGDGLVSQSEDYADMRTGLDVFKDELDRLTYPAPGAGYSFRNEPDDEIRKAKENIRRVKGVLLSARSFPVSTR